MTERPWITILGIGDDGPEGLAPAARALIGSAELLVGGDRHQALVPEAAAERLTWAEGVAGAARAMAAWRGRRVVVLATGDPMCFGAGVTLQRHFAADEMTVIPAPGAWSLACARMLWPLPETTLVTLHGRDPDHLALHLAPGAKLVVFSRDGTTPARVAAMLRERGFGPSRMTVLEHLGGPEEARIEGTAETWERTGVAALNTIALACVAGPDAVVAPRVPGLADGLFEHDGQLTKREVRAVTLAALGPLPGQVLWDVGAGCGSVAIEWMRAGGRAVAVESDPARQALIARNAAFFGVPDLQVVAGAAPAALHGLEPRPDAVFLGGGVSTPGLLEACFEALGPGGRLVANAVTLEAERRLLDFRADQGGELRRLEVSHPKPAGRLTVWDAKAPVTQLATVKP